MFDNTYYCDENRTSARSAVPATTATAASALRHHEGPGRWSQGTAPGNARAAAHPTSPGWWGWCCNACMRKALPSLRARRQRAAMQRRSDALRALFIDAATP